MTDDDLDLREWEHLVQWRLRRLLELGVPSDTADMLASDRTLDWHRVETLIRGGCDPVTAARIVS